MAGKKPLPPASTTGPEFVGATPPDMAEQEIRAHHALLQHETTIRAVAAQLGYQLPADCTDPDLIMRDIAMNMRRSVEACLEVGKGIRVLKEACEHGQFMARLDALGINDGVARKFMQAATKLSKRSTSTVLTSALDSKSKLFEMLVLDDEQIEELELTGQTGELKLDDIATMSVKELRATLRETRQNADAQSRLMADKNAKIDELAGKLVTKQSQIVVPDPDAEGAAIRSEASAFAFEAEATVRGKLNAAFEALAAHTEKSGIPHGEFMSGLLAQLTLAINQLRGEFDIKATPDGSEVPDWLRDGADAALNAGN